ncbi:VOC family protein [Agrococcus jejuensis]|uniref:Glyoxalase-like domain-containing protein n=1 Tax=Agrococcus jejuensis TaxID=399736 RepID=A0A1G8H3D5_9MICO|nr:VOC family protein [Agrococcus jejuensis]SDI01061.1 hypothetical protein SAMN04489720_3193 [Agrococcus jejuensis]
MTIVRQVQVTFDCADPVRVARYWCAALGYELPASVSEGDGSWAVAEDPTGSGPRLYFQRVPEGKVVKNRVHLDVRAATGLVGEERVAALEAECARLVEAGGTRLWLLPANDEDESCLVMQDPEGNEHCLD